MPTEEETLICAHSSGFGEVTPLELGNYWIYDIKNAHGTVTDTLKIEIVSELHSRNGSRVFVMRNQRSSFPQGMRETIWETIEGDAKMVGRISDGDTVWADHVSLPSNPKVGGEFYWYHWGKSEDTGHIEKVDSTLYRTTSINDMIWLKGIQYGANTFEYTFWLAPDANPDTVLLRYISGIGLVEREQRRFRSEPTDNPRQIMTLRDWCVHRSYNDGS